MSTLNLPMNPPSNKRPRRAILNSQKKALRVWYYDDSHHAILGKSKLEACSHWWNQQYGYTISNSTISEIISSKYAHLNEDESLHRRDAKRDRSAKWKALEEALFEWEQRYEGADHVVTGEVLRVKATEFWSKLPCYQDQPVPKWTDGWLTGFKSRYGIKLRVRHGEAADADLSNNTQVIMEQIREEGKKYDADDVFNMDESGYCWLATPERSLGTSEKPGRK